MIPDYVLEATLSTLGDKVWHGTRPTNGKKKLIELSTHVTSLELVCVILHRGMKKYAIHEDIICGNGINKEKLAECLEFI